MTDWGGLREWLDTMFMAMADTPQDSEYHGEGNVWNHTRMVCEALVSSTAYDVAGLDRKFVLFYAALFHDLAKTHCTAESPDGRITSYGHPRKGAVDARILLWRSGVPFGLREDICRLIAAHQKPFWAFKETEYGPDYPVYLARKLSCELSIDELCSLAEADIRGRLCSNNQEILDDIYLFRELAKEEQCYLKPKDFADAHTRVMYFRLKGKIPADVPFHQRPGAEVTLLSGLPASGKDTWARINAQGRPVLSYDGAMQELGVKHGAKDTGRAVQLVQRRCKELLREKRPFIFNATHLSFQMREKAIDLLYAYGAYVDIVYLEAPEPVLYERNSKRDTTLKNSDIERMLMKWEVPLPTEAHSAIYQVSEKYNKIKEQG